MKNFKRVLSMLIVVMMVAAMFVPSFADEAVEVAPATEEAYIDSVGATIKVHNLFDIKDISLAEGEYSTYREVKNNLMVSVTSASNKIADNTFTYVVAHGGIHTVAIRYNDGTQKVLTHEIVVTDPVFTADGLQITVSNLGDDVKTVRTSAGTLNSVQEIKKTAGSRSFSQNHIKYAESFLLQYREEGPVTVVVDYVHGYKVFYHYDVQKKTPTVAYGDDFVKFGNLDDMYVIRYAAGEYATSSEIKKAPGSVAVKSDAIDENGFITIGNLPVNTYTFCVQYNDDSYNYYTVHITVKQWTLTFDPDGGVMDAGFKTSYGINTGDYYKDVFGGAYPTASLDGYVFTGWYLEKYNFTLTAGDVESGYYAVSEDCTLVALWEEAAPALGSYENPYLINVDGDRLAVTIPAGEGAYVKADDSNNSVLTVGYATAATYTISYLPGQVIEVAEDGTASFTMIADKDFFYVGNNGEEDIVLYMSLAAGQAVDTTGTMDNPEVLTLAQNMFGGVGASAGYTFDAGNSGRWYTVTAPADGKIVFSMQGAVDADYNNIGWQYNVQNLTAGKYGDNHWSDDEVVAYDEAWDVKAGDELLIFVTTYDPANMWNSPAGTVNFQLSFEAVGSANNPISITDSYFSTDIAAGSQGMYYTYTAPADGTVEVIMYSENWQYVVNNTTSGVYGDLRSSDDEEPVTCTTLTVSEGDVLTVMVNTYDPANPWNAPAGTLSWELTFSAGSSTDEPVIGSFDLPYNLYAGGTALEITVPAGGEAYVAVDDDNNSTVNVTSSNGAWVIYYGRMTVINPAEDGTASFNMVSGGNYFCVTNPTEADITISMTLTAGETTTDTTGTMDDPKVLELTEMPWGAVQASDEVALAAGNNGYWYTVTAPADGKLYVTPGAFDADYNNIGWTYVVNNLTAGKYGDTHWSDDEEPVYSEEVLVSAGDEVQIFVSTYDPANMWSNPEGTVSVQVSFDAVGSSNCPIAIEAGAQTTTVGEASQGMYYTFTATEEGTVDVIMYSENWQYVVNNTTSGVYGDTQWSDSDPVVPCTTVNVAIGDVLKIMVNTYDPANEWTAPAGTVSWELVFTPAVSDEPSEPVLGDFDMPYQLVADGDTLEITVAAGAEAYVAVDNCNGSVASVVSATSNAYMLIYGRQTVEVAEDGTASFTMMTGGDYFCVFNNGETDVTVVLSLAAGEAVDTTGTVDNPEVLTLAPNMFGAVGATGTADLAAGSEGRYFKVVAPADGVIVFSMQGAVDADYNNIGWQYVINNVNAGRYGDGHWSDDETVVYDEAWTVAAGEELTIFVNTYDPANMWATPAGTVNFQLAFNAVGSVDNPVSVTDDGVYTAAVDAGSQGMYYTYVAPADGTVNVVMTGDGWMFSVNNLTSSVYGDMRYSDNDPLVAYETVEVKAGDELQIMVNTYDGNWQAPEGTVAWSLNFTEAGKAWTITLDADGGVLNAPTTYACNTGDTYMDIFGGYYPVATMEGYEFGGWYLEKYNFTLTEGDVLNGGYYAVSEDCTLVAIWNEL